MAEPHYPLFPGDTYTHLGCSSGLMTRAVLATNSRVRPELAGWIRPNRASRQSRQYDHGHKPGLAQLFEILLQMQVSRS